MTRTEGDRHPLGVGAGGLAILASPHDADIDVALNAVTTRLSTYQLTKEMLREAVATTQERGGLALDEGRATGDVTAIGCTIHDRVRSSVEAIFVALISHRMGKGRPEQIRRQLVDGTSAIEKAMAG